MNYTYAFSNINGKRYNGVCNIEGNYSDVKARVHNILFNFGSCINVVKGNLILSITIFTAPNSTSMLVPVFFFHFPIGY